MKLKYKCKYCGATKNVPPCRVKSSKTYYCGSTECREEHMRNIGKANAKKDFSQLKKLNGWAKKLGHKDLFMN